MRKKIQHVLLFTLIFSLFQGAGAYIGQETTPSLQNWYQSLNKAPLTPEGWVFAVVWPILYLFLAIVATELTVKKTSNVTRFLFSMLTKIIIVTNILCIT